MRTFLSLVLITLLIACQNERSTATNNGIVVENETNIQPTVLEKKDACQYIERGTLAKIMGWNPVGITEQLEESAANGKRSVCSYVHKDQRLVLRVNWASADEQDNSVLVKRYGDYLENGDEGVSYRVVDAQEQSQTLFAINKANAAARRFTMRRRVGTTHDIELVINTTKNAPAEFRTRMLQLMNALEL